MSKQDILNTIVVIDAQVLKLHNSIEEWEKEYEIITDQYMNGDIPFNVGRLQKNCLRSINRLSKDKKKLLAKKRRLLKKLNKMEANIK